MTRIFSTLFLSIAYLCLVGCFTIPVNQVSNVSDKKTISDEQANLRLANRAFGKEARKQGWYEESTGLFGFTDAIVRGIKFYQTDLNVYAKEIKANKEEPDTLYAVILEDVNQATQLLTEVSEATNEILLSQVEFNQKDMSNTETALSVAQLVIQNFNVTLEMLAEKAPVPDNIKVALADFNDEIERCHILSEQLSKGYFKEPAQES